jgi:hypothetical protein
LQALPVKIVYLLQQAQPLPLCVMHLVNRRSSIADKEIFVSVSLLLNVYLVFAIQYLLEHRSQ